MVDVGIHDRDKIDAEELAEQLMKKILEEKRKTVGAIGSFIGVVRGVAKNNELVKFLSYEYSDEALKILKKIATDVEKEPGIWQVLIHHMVGQLKPGDIAICVFVSGERRHEVFSALQKTVDRIKKEVPIWKKEVTKRGEYWVQGV
jgi:molybdopterin synthase catalytic subunit